MGAFRCPLCKAKLEKQERSFRCEHGHSFDISAEGYVHLLPANKMNSKIPGDSKEMAASRSAFLDKGYYEPLLLELEKTVLGLSEGEKPSVLDCGCGEGYYTSNIAKELKNRFPKAKIAGFDILLNVFSPLSIEEYKRVLKPGGYYIYVVPAARHLWQLKAAIYDTPYENKEEDTPYEGFEHVETRRVRYEANIQTKEDIFALFQMTPYYWKTSAKGAEKLSAYESLLTEVAFDIHIYKKEK